LFNMLPLAYTNPIGAETLSLENIMQQTFCWRQYFCHHLT